MPVKRTIIGAVCAVFLCGCTSPPAELPPPKEFTSVAEEQCFQFVTQKMMADGGIYTQYIDTDQSAEIATGHEVLSESQGLFMRYCQMRGDKDGFDAAFRFMQAHLNTKELLSYRYSPSWNKQYAVNAAVDDLRIIRALKDGGVTFQDRAYTKAAKQYAARLKKTNVKNGYLYDLYDGQMKTTNQFITLCYADLTTLDALAEFQKDWSAISANMQNVLLDGYLSDAFPFFHTRYNYVTGQYECPNQINTVESVLTALHLAQKGLCPGPTLDYLKQKVAAGTLYGQYDMAGNALNDIESSAVYALCAILGAAVDDPAIYESSMEQLRRFQVTTAQSEVSGAFAFGTAAYSFDNLNALLAFREAAQ